MLECPLPLLHKEDSKKEFNSHLGKITYKGITKGGLKNDKITDILEEP